MSSSPTSKSPSYDDISTASSPSSGYSKLSLEESDDARSSVDSEHHADSPVKPAQALVERLQSVPLGKGECLLFICGSQESPREDVPGQQLEDILGSVFETNLLKGGNWVAEKNDSDLHKFVGTNAKPAYSFTKMAFTESPSHADLLNAFSQANLHLIYSTPFPSATTSTLYILERPAFNFPPLVRGPGAKPYGPPTREEWRDLWRAWDLVTLKMIPESMLHQKPIDLRHICLFYIGHIPTFVNILLSRYIKEPYVEPTNFTTIFERGIDPHVDDPTHCHSHSEVPEADEDWPLLSSVLAYRDRVRARLLRVYDEVDAGTRPMTHRLARILQMTLEHEGFHIETLLYMLIQKAGEGTNPPPGFTRPPFEMLARQWDARPKAETDIVTLGPAQLTVGHDDSELEDDARDASTSSSSTAVYSHEFGWDNESPVRTIPVSKFRISTRPITNGEFHTYYTGEGKDKVKMPASWRVVDGNVHVLTVYGPIPLEHAKHWPVLAAYEDLTAYAKSKGGRIPTESELRLFLDTYEVGYDAGANAGFRAWHPVPATAGGPQNGGRGSNGGVWEWTSTHFATHPGLAPTSIFPGYSSDFFDGVHHSVLGASYATIPRLACRRTVRNFYQRNYPYAWVGARLAYDCK